MHHARLQRHSNAFVGGCCSAAVCLIIVERSSPMRGLRISWACRIAPDAFEVPRAASPGRAGSPPRATRSRFANRRACIPRQPARARGMAREIESGRLDRAASTARRCLLRGAGTSRPRHWLRQGGVPRPARTTSFLEIHFPFPATRYCPESLSRRPRARRRASTEQDRLGVGDRDIPVQRRTLIGHVFDAAPLTSTRQCSM